MNIRDGDVSVVSGECTIRQWPAERDGVGWVVPVPCCPVAGEERLDDRNADVLEMCKVEER